MRKSPQVEGPDAKARSAFVTGSEREPQGTKRAVEGGGKNMSGPASLALTGHKGLLHALNEWTVFMSFFLLLVLICLAFVAARIEVLRIGYSLSAAREVRRALLRDNSRLLLEIATLRSPERIERIALTELGMIYPAPEQVIQADE